MFLAYLCIILGILHLGVSQSSRELDSVLQDYAFRAFVRPRTGVVFDGRVPLNFTGIRVAALRLRSGSLRRKGVSYKEFSIPVGVVEQPYVERLVLVYQNLGNWSSLYYSLPGYTLLAPVLGLLAYDATNLSATNLSELDIRVSGQPISIDFPNVQSRPRGSSLSPKCVYFNLDGSVEFNNVVRGNTCLITNQGHFSIVVESLLAPAPSPSTNTGGGTGRRRRSSKRVWIIVGSVIGGAVLLALLALLFVCVRKCRQKKKIRRMEEEAEWGVPLPTTRVGYTKAPRAPETRTRPLLETEYVP